MFFDSHSICLLLKHLAVVLCSSSPLHTLYCYYSHMFNNAVLHCGMLCYRKPSPGFSTETVTGLYIRTLDRKNAVDNETMHALADMLLHSSGQSV